MEEDIEILQEILSRPMYYFNTELSFEAIQIRAKAIENILARLEQLEKENEECKLDVQDYLKQAQENAEIYRKAQKKIQDLKANSIPKSIVENKIEELEANKNMNIMARSSQIDILKELLGGSNE